MTAKPEHDHDRLCRAVQFDPETGRYTGTRAADLEQCATCRGEAVTADHPTSTTGEDSGEER